jgi:tetratricopeptide (TPR) repeat protein
LVDDIRVEGADITIRDEDILRKVEPDQARKAVVFFHGLMHDGSPPNLIFRASVYYKRDPETAPILSEEYKEARRVLNEAIFAAEEGGQIDLAIRLYKQAYRLDPSLDN